MGLSAFVLALYSWSANPLWGISGLQLLTAPHTNLRSTEMDMEPIPLLKTITKKSQNFNAKSVMSTLSQSICPAVSYFDRHHKVLELFHSWNCLDMKFPEAEDNWEQVKKIMLCLHVRSEPHRHACFPFCRMRISGVILCCFLITKKVSLFTGSTRATTKTLVKPKGEPCSDTWRDR